MTTGADETDLSLAVVEAVAEREGVPVGELEPSLHTAVDPDALNRLFNDSSGMVSFQYAGYLVMVDESGTVEIREAAEDKPVY